MVNLSSKTGLVLLGVLALSITPGVILYHQHVTGAAGGDGFVKSLIYQLKPHPKPKVPQRPVNCVKVQEVAEHDCKKDDFRYYSTNDHYLAREAIDKDTNLVCKELDPDMYSHLENDNGEKVTPLMVMMSTVGKTDPNDAMGTVRGTLQKGAAATWRSLQPDIITVMAVDDEETKPPIKGFPRVLCPSNVAGTPYVGALMMHGVQRAEKIGARFTGYTNGDIAFDSTVIDVLKGVSHAIDRGLVSNRVLLIGKRLNIDDALHDAEELLRMVEDGLPNLRERIRRALVRFSHRTTNTWMSENSEDFFFFTKDTFDWADIPDFVVGRVGWDSWLTQWALDHGVDVIDTTQLLHVSHLTGKDGNLAGWHTFKPDKMWNYCALKSKCVNDPDNWQKFCKSCFRCKIGSTGQGAFTLSPISRRSRKITVSRLAPPSGFELLRVKKYWMEISKTVMDSYSLPRWMASHYLASLLEDQSCRSKGTCCSVQGGWGVELEISKLKTVRGWVPSVLGFPDLYNSTSWSSLTNITDPRLVGVDAV